jgi:hypothetical protein
MQPDIIAAAAGILTVIIAIIAILVDGNRNRISRQTQLLLGLSEQWNSKDTKALRRAASQNLIKKRLPNYELSELLDFLSMICFLYGSNGFDNKMLTNQFGWWILRYWLCAKEWVEKVRVIDPGGWQSVETIANKLMEELKRDKFPIPNDDELKVFLKIESILFVRK